MRRIDCARFLLALAFVAALPATGAAQTRTFAQVTGHDFGERITVHHEMVDYVHHLAATSPRVSVEILGESWEGRDFLLAIVTSPENHARLDEIRRNAQRLGDPRVTTAAQAQAIMADQPTIGWFGGSIHGFELSGAEGILKALERLATSDDPATLEILENSVILIDPMLNPDGRDAFAARNNENLGIEPNPSRDDWGNSYNSWQALQFRTGHYFFDTNRDWFAHTQRETRHRVPVLVEWRPQAVVDMHEMGSDVEFYFDPATDPWPPFFPRFAREGFETFNQAYAAAFDTAGFEYMTRERYNYFYPAYTTSYGSYQGAVGMLYEQGSTRGLAITRPDGTTRTLADALEQQYLAAFTAMRTLATNRSEFLQAYYDGMVAAVDDGTRGNRRYLIPPGGDPTNRLELARTLHRNGIEVHRLDSDVRLSGVTPVGVSEESGQRVFPAGTFVIEAAQPLNSLVRTLLEAEGPLPEDFLAEARDRVDRGRSARFYDITAWSLPMLFNLPAFASTDGRAIDASPFDGSQEHGVFPEVEPEYAYLIDGSQAGAPAALWHLKDRGFRVAMTYAPTRIDGADFSSGTVIVRVRQNPESVVPALREIARLLELDVRGVNSGLADGDLPSLGSGDWTFTVNSAEIAIVAEGPISGYSFGWAWYTLSERFRIPVTVLRSSTLGGTNLDRFDTIVFPSVFGGGQLVEMLGESGRTRLNQWVQDGGTLVALGSATDFVVNNLEMASLRSWYGLEENEDAQRFSEPGAFLRGVVNQPEWLTAGYDAAEIPVLMNSSRIYLPPEGPPSGSRRVVIHYAESDRMKIAGHLWPESTERLPGAVFAYEERRGAGRVILFVEDINFRAFWRGMNRLFLNAVVVGPSAP